MGLTVHYDFHAPATDTESKVHERLAALRVLALALPVEGVSELVQFTEAELTGPWPMRGLAFPRLVDVFDVAARSVREDLYRRRTGVADGDYSRLDVPGSFAVRAIGFGVALGPGSEPAAFGLATMHPPGSAAWSWHSFCKTQYASVHGDENFLRCHGSLVALLDAARNLGFEVAVHDETGYWESRDASDVLVRVAEMNRLVARFAGVFVDHARAAGADTRQIEGEIFAHPDFERLETDG